MLSPEYQQRLLDTIPYLQDPRLVEQIRTIGLRFLNETQVYPLGVFQLPERELHLGLKLRSDMSKASLLCYKYRKKEDLVVEMQVFEWFHALGLPVPHISLLVTDGEKYGILTEDLSQDGSLSVTGLAYLNDIPDTLDNADELRSLYLDTLICKATGSGTYTGSLFVAHRRDKTERGRPCYLDVDHMIFPEDVESALVEEAQKYLREPLLLRV